MTTFFEKVFNVLNKISKLHLLGFLLFSSIKKILNIDDQIIINIIMVFSVSTLLVFIIYNKIIMQTEPDEKKLKFGYVAFNLFIALSVCLILIPIGNYQWMLKTWNTLFGDFFTLNYIHFTYVHALFTYILEYISLCLVFKNSIRVNTETDEIENSDLKIYLLLLALYCIFAIFSLIER